MVQTIFPFVPVGTSGVVRFLDLRVLGLLYRLSFADRSALYFQKAKLFGRDSVAGFD